VTARLTNRAGDAGSDAPIRLLADVTPEGWQGETWAMAVDVFPPAAGVRSDRGTVLCCLPGGGVDRRYYDLRVASDDTYSFGRHLSDEGLVVVTLDHLGVGESTPAPAELLTVEVLAAAAHRAMTAVMESLRSGDLDAGLSGLDRLVSVGVGHSMGAMLTVEQQATHRTHDALALLGFGNRGLPDLLHPSVLALADDPDELRRRIPGLWREQADARASAPPPTPAAGPRRDGRRAGAPFFHGEHLPADVVAAVKAISAPAPGVAALTSMVPGSVRREMAALDVPILLANGELDFTGPIHEIGAGFSACRDLTLLELPGAGHSHHAFPARLQLWDRLAAWTRSLPYAVR
jgi:alpha-beta hydrolase superfamily lysophospholipase